MIQYLICLLLGAIGGIMLLFMFCSLYVSEQEYEHDQEMKRYIKQMKDLEDHCFIMLRPTDGTEHNVEFYDLDGNKINFKEKENENINK